MSGYDESNIFAKILRGELPCHKVYEDEVALAFMDVMPQGDGHTLVIPKKAKARNVLDMDADELASLMPRVQKVARAVKAAFAADGLMLVQYNESAAGQTVFHPHVHVIPRFEGLALKPHSGKMADYDLLKGHAARIAAALQAAEGARLVPRSAAAGTVSPCNRSRQCTFSRRLRREGGAMIGHWVWVILIGFVAGLIARFLIPGPNNPSGFVMTAVLGVVGSFLANLVAEKLGWIADRSEGGHLLSGIVGAVVILVVYHFVASQSTASNV